MSSIKNDEKHTNESMSAYQMLGNHSFNNRELKSPVSLRKGQDFDFEKIEEEEQEVLDYTARKKPSYSISNPKKNFTHIQSNTTSKKKLIKSISKSMTSIKRPPPVPPKPETLDDLIKRSKHTVDTLEMLKSYLSLNDIPCFKYHYTVNGAPIIFDKYKSTLRLSKDKTKLIIHNFKPEENY